MSIQIAPPETRTLALADIKPYFRNPRKIPQNAIDQVRSSIERYGYQQSIVVDPDNVVVVGHTRLLALQQLPDPPQQVEVYVTHLPADKVREYRLVDNRTSELSQWDPSALVMELREFETSLLEEFFPEVDLEISAINDVLVNSNDVDAANKKLLDVKLDNPLLVTLVECPACFERFEVSTASLPGLSRADLATLTAAQLEPADDGETG